MVGISNAMNIVFDEVMRAGELTMKTGCWLFGLGIVTVLVGFVMIGVGAMDSKIRAQREIKACEHHES